MLEKNKPETFQYVFKPYGKLPNTWKEVLYATLNSKGGVSKHIVWFWSWVANHIHKSRYPWWKYTSFTCVFYEDLHCVYAEPSPPVMLTNVY